MLQNCRLPYAVKCESHHLYWSIHRNCKMCEQFKAGRKSNHVVVVGLACIPPRGDLMAPTSVNRSVCVRMHVILKRPSEHSLSFWKGYCTILSRSMRPWVIICLACVSHASLTCPALLIFHLSMWAFPTVMDVTLCQIFSIPAPRPAESCVPGPSAAKPRWQPLILSKLCEKAFLLYFSSWCFVKIRLMQSINLGRIKP